VLAARNKELVSLLSDGDLLLQELRKRREDIHTLLVSTVTLSQQLTGLVRDNREAIRPALENLKNVLATLQANQDNLDRSIKLLAPFVRVFANTTGNGRWFDTYIQNLVPVPGGPGSPT
jgi:phospholipid/cholesterol/gamma-HCH transport system substrate-binding protein